jgi:serine/threonine-protein kinase
MELLRGRDLERIVRENGPITAVNVVEYLRQMARALDKAHALGIVHRDLKPENLFLTEREDGSPCIKLLDFGIARLADVDGPALSTQVGYVVGTPNYMAPEQTAGDPARVGAGTDIWAIGLVAFKLLVGQEFFTGSTSAQLYAQILAEPIASPSERGSTLGPAFDAWFARCVTRNVGDRYPSAGEAVRGLAMAVGVELRERYSSHAVLPPSVSPSQPSVPDLASAHAPSGGPLTELPMGLPRRGSRLGRTAVLVVIGLAGLGAGVYGVRSLRAAPPAEGLVAPSAASAPPSQTVPVAETPSAEPTSPVAVIPENHASAHTGPGREAKPRAYRRDRANRRPVKGRNSHAHQGTEETPRRARAPLQTRGRTRQPNARQSARRSFTEVPDSDADTNDALDHGSALVRSGVVGMLFAACVEPPPKIAAIPAGGLALRLYVFGASALDARQAFDAAKHTNKNLRIVREGGDGELLVGLENDSPKCVAPMALCSFKVALRIKNNDGKVVHRSTTTASANAERCADLCDRALSSMVVKAIEAASAALKGGEGDAATEMTETANDADAGDVDAAPAAASSTTPTPKPVKKAAEKSTRGEGGADRAAETGACHLQRRPWAALAIGRSGEAGSSSRSAEAHRCSRAGRVRLPAEGLPRSTLNGGASGAKPLPSIFAQIHRSWSRRRRRLR